MKKKCKYESIFSVKKEAFKMSSNMSNVNVNVNSKVVDGLNNMIMRIVREVITECGSIHNFDASEMIERMNMSVVVGGGGCGSGRVSSKKEKIVKEKKEKKEKKVVVKSKLPMPFNGSIDVNCCSALRQNQGLYTQCETSVSDGGFCKKCGPSQNYGTIQQRLEVGIMEFRDPKGKSPTPFVKIMNKLKISREDVELEAYNLGIVINDIHFVSEEKKEKGRPKKPRRKIELADDSTDLFAVLVAKANEDSEDEISDLSCDEKSSIAESIIDSVLDKVSVNSENNEKKAEKEALKLSEKAEKEAIKQAQIQKKEAELAEKEAIKQEQIQKKAVELAEKEAIKQEQIQKKAVELAEKEAIKQAQIQKKEAEKEAIKQAQIQKKEAEKAEKEATNKFYEKKASTVKAKKVSSDSEATKPAKKAAKVEEEEEDIVKRFEFEGVKYLKSKKTGIIYNMDQDAIGKWNEKAGKIDFTEAGSEEEADEYDE
jgi:chemotaxis protein histidine kinase CheA